MRKKGGRSLSDVKRYTLINSLFVIQLSLKTPAQSTKKCAMKKVYSGPKGRNSPMKVNKFACKKTSGSIPNGEKFFHKASYLIIHAIL